jgi:hypothetical protein
MPAETQDSSPPKTILAFDIGIRNLAWCLMRGAKEQPQIISWHNYDLLSGADAGTAAAKKIPCSKCSVKASWTAPDGAVYCMRHCPQATPPLKDLSGNLLTKIPSVAVLRPLAAAAATAAGLTPPKKSASREVLLGLLKPRHAFPLERVKLKKAVEHDLTLIHDAIRSMVAANAADFGQATHIFLENQPVLKNPTMKSVQILLFATLRDLLQPGPPPLKLVHAGKKIVGKAAGDAGYKSRKDASEEKVEELLKGEKVVDAAHWLQTFKGCAKKSDLADAFLMCWAGVGME